MRPHLIKLARAIQNAKGMEELVVRSTLPNLVNPREEPESVLPLEEEQRRHEASAPYGEPLDLTLEPSTEYMD